MLGESPGGPDLGRLDFGRFDDVVVSPGFAPHTPVARASLDAGLPVYSEPELAWRLRVVPVGPGWLDMGMSAPLLDTGRAERELGWRPAHGAVETLREMVDGMAAGAGTASPPLRARHGGL